jgi:UDP-glucose 4-epimerase
MKILLTGATSLSGYWIHQTLCQKGHSVTSTFTRSGFDDYQTDKSFLRTQKLRSNCNSVFKAAFGSDGFCKLISENKFDVICLHGAHIPNYKSPDFDVQNCVQVNLANANKVFEILKNSKTQILYTGTVFEPNEGDFGKPTVAVSPYGTAKALIGEKIKSYCHSQNLKFKKFLIPNPFGPFEDKKYTWYLMDQWMQNKPADVKFPDYIRDNIFVQTLALAYEHFLSSDLQYFRPSQFALSQGQFTKLLAGEVRARTGLACEVNILKQTEYSEPLSRLNSDKTDFLLSQFSLSTGWDQFVEFYQSQKKTPT